MSRTAIGMVETVGLLAAYEAADVAVKSANVKLIGYEISRGGMVVIKFSGDIGAVKSAVDAAATAASRLGKVFSSHVIPRPHQDIDKKMIFTDDTVGYKKDKNLEENVEKTSEESKEIVETKESKETKEESKEIVETKESKEETEEADIEDQLEDVDLEEQEEEIEADTQESNEEFDEELEKDDGDICNLCGDPDCPRRKGELRTDCIHYDEIMGTDE